MKKFLFGFVFAIVAFAIGVVAFESLNFESIFIPDDVVNESESTKGQLVVIEPNNSEEDFLDDNQSNEEFFNGWYALDDRMIKEMNEVRMVSISRFQNPTVDQTYSTKIIQSASIFTILENYGDQGAFASVSTQIDEDGVNFRTEKIKGIEYKFKGVFFKDKTMGVDGEKLLRGTLQKFVNSKKVAEVSGDFAYYEPHCWH